MIEEPKELHRKESESGKSKREERKEEKIDQQKENEGKGGKSRRSGEVFMLLHFTVMSCRAR